MAVGFGVGVDVGVAVGVAVGAAVGVAVDAAAGVSVATAGDVTTGVETAFALLTFFFTRITTTPTFLFFLPSFSFTVTLAVPAFKALTFPALDTLAIDFWDDWNVYFAFFFLFLIPIFLLCPALSVIFFVCKAAFAPFFACPSRHGCRQRAAASITLTIFFVFMCLTPPYFLHISYTEILPPCIFPNKLFIME